MAEQLDLAAAPRRSSSRKGPAPRGASGWLRLTLYWAPVWLAGLVFAQLALFGLRPARQESLRLDRETAQMDTRMAGLRDDHVQLRLDRRRLDDEMYRERVRRSARRGQPLTLKAAREQARSHRADER